MKSRREIPTFSAVRARRWRWALASTGAAACVLLTAPAVGVETTAPPLVRPGAPGEPARVLSPEESVALGQSRYTDADVAFMQHMIVHHAQAVEMGDLIAERTTHPGIRLIGNRIAVSQTAEIEMMRTWLARRGEALDMPGGHDHHANTSESGPATTPSDVPVMPGMLSPRQMAELGASRAAEFDRLYLIGMIQHHQGAIDMVNALLVEPGAGEDPEISDFLGGIFADQSAEILRMKSMLAALGS